MTRRELLRVMAAAGLGAPFASTVVAQQSSEHALPTGKSKELEPMEVPGRRLYPAELRGGKVVQPERPLDVIHETDVLIVGGGPAGFAAAVSAARAGAKTCIVERYGYFGGLWTGGLVLLVISTHVKENGQRIKVMRGIGDELVDRVDRVGGMIYRQSAETPDKFNPTTDAEATKYIMDQMIAESGAKVYFHSWVVDVIMDGGAVRGAVIESKAGRQAILAKVVVDASGDGDVFAAAGAEHERRLHAIGLVHRVGNYDRADREKLKAAGIKGLGGIEPEPSARWINLRGPSEDNLDIEVLTRLEMEHRRSIWERTQKLRKTPGGESIFLLQTAPQLGVRTSRLLAGVHQLTFKDSREGRKFPDAIGVGGAQAAQHVGWPIPYGALLPKKLDNLIAAGRCIACDQKLIEDMRLIAACLITGHGAGAAAAVAVKSGCRPRDVDVAKVQALLREQGAYLG